MHQGTQPNVSGLLSDLNSEASVQAEIGLDREKPLDMSPSPPTGS